MLCSSITLGNLPEATALLDNNIHTPHEMSTILAYSPENKAGEDKGGSICAVFSRNNLWRENPLVESTVAWSGQVAKYPRGILVRVDTAN